MFIADTWEILSLPNDIPREMREGPSGYFDSFAEPETIERQPEDVGVVCNVCFEDL